MRLTAQHITLLNLSSREVAVLKVLAKEPLLISQIVTKSHIPRMTLYPTLKLLVRRTLVLQIKHGKRWLYQLGDPHQLTRNAFQDAVNPTHYHGTAEILTLYSMLFGLHASKRVCVVQSTSSAHQMLMQAKEPAIHQLNTEIKRNHILIDVIVSPSILNLSKSQSSSWKKTIEGRSTSVTLVSEKSMQFMSELWIFNDRIVLTNWKTGTATVIQDKEVVSMLKEMFYAFKESGKRFDSNEFLRKSLQE